VVRNATFTDASESWQKASSGRKVTPTPVDKPFVNRSFAAAAAAASEGSLATDSGHGQLSASTACDSAKSGNPGPSLSDMPQTPCAQWMDSASHKAGRRDAGSSALGCSHGQLSASTAYDSATSGNSWPSLAGTPQTPRMQTNRSAPPKAEFRSAGRGRQPSPLSGRSLTISGTPRDGASTDGPLMGPQSGTGKHDSLAQRLGDLQVPSGTSDGAPAGSSPWAQQSLTQKSSGATQTSASKQASLAQRVGDLHASSGASDCATAGSSPWTQHITAQKSSGAILSAVSPWECSSNREPDSAAASSAASNTPQRGASPNSREPSAPPVTPGSAVNVKGGLKPTDLPSNGPCGPDAWAASPATPASGFVQTGDSSLAQKRLSPERPEFQGATHKASLSSCEGFGQPNDLPNKVRRAAMLHSALIRHTAHVQLAAELESLLRLLAVPAAVHEDATNGSALLLSSGRIAAEYACRVLRATGTLTSTERPKDLEQYLFGKMSDDANQ